MYEYTATHTRQNTEHDFFIFQTEDKQLLDKQNKFRNDMLQANGFISLNAIVSENKLQLKISTLWESEATARAFTSVHQAEFLKLLKAYQYKTGTYTATTTATLPDTLNLKAKKLSSRLTVAEASKELKDFITCPPKK